MGCDIHIVIERRRNGGAWERVPFATTPWEDREKEPDSYWWREFDARTRGGAVAMPSCFDGRNYNLFGILANVRNGSGFAGISTGESWPPIADYRGLPADWSGALEPCELGDHSTTWASLQELKDYPWDTTLRRLRGLVAFQVWRDWQASESLRPTGWCGMASGGGTEIISHAAALERTAKIHDMLYVESSWTETARQATRDWIGQVAPILDQIADRGELRLVFGFDS